jgi:hypothetical protein
MATLGAKPNHAFFHCQHPVRKKIPQHASTPHHTSRRSSHAPWPATRAQRACQSTRVKKNIFFPVVLFTARVARRVCATSAGDGAGVRPGCVPASERSALVISSKGRFFVSHKPDCAKVRELFDAFRAIEPVHRTHRHGVEVSIATCWDTRTALVRPRTTIRIRVASTSETASRRTCTPMRPPRQARKEKAARGRRERLRKTGTRTEPPGTRKTQDQ